MPQPGEPGSIAFIGLGAMGFGMATNLLKHGFTVIGYDAYAPTLARFVDAGGKSSKSPAEAVRGVQFTILMVATSVQVYSVLFDDAVGASHALAQDAVVICCSTGPMGYVAGVRSHLDAVQRRDVLVVDAPVSGGTIRAREGTLTIMASGVEAAITEAKQVLDAMASEKGMYVIPGELGAGTKVKMVHQVLAGIHIVMTSEAIGFAKALGLNPRRAFERLKTSEGTSWMFENRVPHLLDDDEIIHSALNIIVKDVLIIQWGIVTAGGRAHKIPLFLSSATEQVLLSGVQAGLGLVDDSRLVHVYMPEKTFRHADPPLKSEEEGAKLQLVIDAMSAVHLAATAEAMSLGRLVGLEAKQLFDIIAGAAGASWMFLDRIPGLLSGEWKQERSIESTIKGLSNSMEEANRLRYPLHLAGTALQLFQAVGLRGALAEPDMAISKIWDSETPLFPRNVAK